MLDNESKEKLSEDEDDTNIFGKGLADKIARLPGIPYEDGEQQKPKSKYKHSYLSSIQSIRTIEKEKINQVLQEEVNKLSALDRKFKQILESKVNNQRGTGKYRSANRKPLYETPETNSTIQKSKNKNNLNENLIKF